MGTSGSVLHTSRRIRKYSYNIILTVVSLLLKVNRDCSLVVLSVEITDDRTVMDGYTASVDSDG